MASIRSLSNRKRKKRDRKMLNQCIISGFADEIDQDFFKQLAVLEELKQTHIELRSIDGINISNFTIEQAYRYKEILDVHNVKVSALGSPIGKIGITDNFGEHFQVFKHVVKLAHIFETQYIRMFSFYIPNGENPYDYEKDVIARLSEMVIYAEEEKIILLHENEKGIFGDTADRCKILFDQLESDSFRMTFDFANFVQCKENTLNAYHLLKNKIAYIHIKDALYSNEEVVLPGEGDGNLIEILQLLEQDGYHGYLSLEPHLFHFVGFSDLELEEIEKHETNGIVAYKKAFNKLNKLIDKYIA